MNYKKDKILFAISGVAGAGKDTLLNFLRDKGCTVSVSYTDREPREGEIDGVSYNFISKKEFTEAIEAGEFIEWEKTRGETRYGKKREEFERAYNSSQTTVMQIDVLGAQKFKKMGYRVVSIFIIPPSLDEAMRRLKARNTDAEDQLKLRVERYEMEMSFKDKYDHVIINDDLNRAKKELFELINLEINKKGHKKTFQNVFFNFFLLLFFAVLTGSAAAKYYLDYTNSKNQIKENIASSSIVESPATDIESLSEPEPAPEPPKKQEAKVVAPPSKEAKKKIAAEPPKQPAPKTSAIVEETKTNNDGSVTTVVSTGGDVAKEDVERVTESTVSVASPYDIAYRDETGLYPDFGAELKEYLNSILKWRNEVSSMKELTIRDAGATGWTGQYLGQYTVAANGIDITAATGSIILNTYYYKTSPYFNDYIKLTLAHEYGHHYTLYHKWVDWDLPIGVRFPDSYYSNRPLSKAATAVDYSLGWKNCEVEVIAEDYSYLYSGYGYHAMSGTYGYPSAWTKTWLDTVGSKPIAEEVVSEENVAPTIEITSPIASATLTGTVSFAANASDDEAVIKVSFYVDDQLLSDDTEAPYEASLNSTLYANGPHTLKAVAYDSILSAQNQITVTFSNEVTDTIAPSINIIEPATNPYILSSDLLSASVHGEDETTFNRIELYIEDEYQQSWNVADLALTIDFTGVQAGTYNIKFKAFDQAGNSTEAILVVIKN